MSEWKKEFEVFLNEKPLTPDGALSAQILGRVKNDLNPPVFKVFGKLLATHVVGGALSLTVCPQFGIGPIGGGHGWMGAVMKYGNIACALFCGSVFLFATAVLSAFVMKKTELKVLARNQFWQFPLLAGLSFAGLMLVGGETPSVNVEFLIFWCIGAIFASWSGQTLAKTLRNQLDNMGQTG